MPTEKIQTNTKQCKFTDRFQIEHSNIWYTSAFINEEQLQPKIQCHITIEITITK